MSFIDLFVDRGTKDKPVPNKADSTGRQGMTTPTPVYIAPTGGSVAEFTEHFKQILKDENQKNFPGNDYYEFYLVKSNLTSLPEQQAYVVAFNGLSAAGLSKEKLLETARNYLGIVEREIREFTGSYDQMYNTEVTSVEQSINQKIEEIREYTQKISTLNTEVAELRTRAMSNTQRLSDKKNGFMLAGNSQKQEIENEINKINQYIS